MSVRSSFQEDRVFQTETRDDGIGPQVEQFIHLLSYSTVAQDIAFRVLNFCRTGCIYKEADRV